MFKISGCWNIYDCLCNVNEVGDKKKKKNTWQILI